jgi:hypothetical protein
MNFDAISGVFVILFIVLVCILILAFPLFDMLSHWFAKKRRADIAKAKSPRFRENEPSE